MARNVIILFLGLFLVVFQNTVKAFDHKYQSFTYLLKRNVRDGLVDYSSLKESSKELNAYLDELASVTEGDFNGWTRDQQLAFLINLYNSQTLALILDHYPIGSIQEIGSALKGPFDQPVVLLFGKQVTLNYLEHEVLRARYQEPRIHFALVCAARACPPLRQEAYQSERLDQQLNDQVNIFLNDPSKNQLRPNDSKIKLSPIFKWFAEDFNKKAGLVPLYLRQFVPADVAESLTRKDLTIEYTDYDWSLNDQKANPRSVKAIGVIYYRILNSISKWEPGAGLGFSGLYCLATVLFLPGAILTLASGVLFGVIWGTIWVSLGSTVGATIAFLISRYLARDWIKRKIAGNNRFQNLDKALQREGWKVILLLRLSPIFPFNLLNYALGITAIPLRHYIVASWIGMLPGTILYVYIGSLAGNLANLVAGGRSRSTAEWIFYGLGLAATLWVTFFITRLAKKRLGERFDQKEYEGK